MATLSAISWRSSDGRSMKGDSILEVVDRCASSVGSLRMEGGGCVRNLWRFVLRGWKGEAYICRTSKHASVIVSERVSMILYVTKNPTISNRFWKGVSRVPYCVVRLEQDLLLFIYQ
jgi:hypothetical protein